MPSVTSAERTTFCSGNRIVVVAIHKDLQQGWLDHNWRLAPEKVEGLLEDRYFGQITNRYFFTPQKLVFKHAPNTPSSVKTAYRWINAGYLPIHDMCDSGYMTRFMFEIAERDRPDVLVCMSSGTIPNMTLKDLHQLGTQVVMLSPLKEAGPYGFALETIPLRKLVANEIPPRKTFKHKSNGQFRMSRVPPFDTKPLLENLEWVAPDLHRQIAILLTANNFYPKNFFRGLVYRAKAGTLSDLLLALLFLLDGALVPGTIQVDEDELLSRLREWGVSNHEAEIASQHALKILWETEDLIYADDAYHYARFFENWGAHKAARRACRQIGHQVAKQTIKAGIKAEPAPVRLTGIRFLDACYRAIETLCKTGACNDQDREHIDTWCAIHGLVWMKKLPTAEQLLDRIYKDFDEVCAEFEKIGVDRASATIFEDRVSDLLTEPRGQSASSMACDAGSLALLV